jgi:NitT/TauT family transport system substrate-binding protein
VRLSATPRVSDCFTPIYAARALLKSEGFTEVSFVVDSGKNPDWRYWLAECQYDFDWAFAPEAARMIDMGISLKVLAGLHAGCLELIADESVASVKELKGRRVGINENNSGPHVLLQLMTANVGLDPAKDIVWVTGNELIDKLAAGEIDALLGTPPEPQIARARGAGHVILNSTRDPPWSRYFCCMMLGNVDFVASNPVATKRILRALLKAADLCVSNPQLAARLSVDEGMASSYENALQTLKDARYDAWRSYDAEDAMRFYSLRLLEAGLITKSPEDIIARGTDWRFLNELKRELKT